MMRIYGPQKRILGLMDACVTLREKQEKIFATDYLFSLIASCLSVNLRGKETKPETDGESLFAIYAI